jgi:hypothetical protein
MRALQSQLMLKILTVTLICTAPMGAHATEYVCRAAKGGTNHILRIKIDHDRISSIFYGSMTSNGYTCEFAANRGDGSSTWVDQADGRVSVGLSIDGVDAASLMLAQSGSKVTIKVESSIGQMCGVGGHIASLAVLEMQRKSCVLGDLHQQGAGLRS